MRFLLITFFLLSAFVFPAKSADPMVFGRVRDAVSGDFLTGVTILALGTDKGAVTGPDGRYELFLPQGNHRLRFSFVGYEQQQISIELRLNTRLDLELTPSSETLGEVVVAAEQSRRNLERAEMGVVRIDAQAIRNIPAFLGESDVLRSIQLLPGVQGAGDGNTGFFVRGGNADQNLVLLDEAVVYNPSHLFNFFSVFNPDAIADLQLFKGGISAAYGGRLSSVLDINMRSGDKNRFHARGGIGLISSRLTLEGPIQQGKSAFLISGRRTYADLFLKLSSDENQRNTSLYFYDLNAKANLVIDDRNRLFVSGYYGRDVTSLSGLFGFDWGNATATLRWNRFFHSDFFSDLSLVYSHYDFRITGDIGPASFRWKGGLSEISLRSGFFYKLHEGGILRWGFQLTRFNNDPGTIASGFEGVSSTSLSLSGKYANQYAAYIGHEISTPDDKLALHYGIRLSVFDVIGPGNQYVFDTSSENGWRVMDTIQLTKGNRYQRFSGPEPRISMRLSLGSDDALKLGYNRMRQYIQQAQSAQSVAPYDVWFMASNNIPPQMADQWSLGYFRNLTSGGIEASAEAYYKQFDQIADIIDNGDLLANELLESQLRIGRGWSYGLELLLKKPEGRLNGFVGYTWSVSRREIEGINNGLPYYAPNDRRHDLSLSGSYALNDVFSLGGSFIYATGRAFTLPVGKLSYQGTTAPIFADRNSSRLPDYHRMDLSLTYTPIKAGRRFESSWNFSVFNLYGRVNPISVSFASSSERPADPRTSFFYIPGPIPAITWNFNF